ncbi:helix-turn-helix domain-containing protein [Labilibacter sediminis]|nr:helix-turn-helix domain-containing protein [Labilibacter sediminis]
MKLKYKSTQNEIKSAIAIDRINVRHYEQNWHYHDEHELIYYIKGKGTRVVGDNLSDFGKKDLVLVGAGLPHLWKNNDEVEYEGLDLIVIKFDIDHPGFSLLSIAEFVNIKRMLNLAQSGIRFCPKTADKVHGLLIALTEADHAMQIILLLQVLDILSKSNKYQTLASQEFSLSKSSSEEDRLSRIINYLSGNYLNQITLDDISREAAMTPNSLCRFFKTRTNKTIFQFLNEFRIGKACELLINGNLSITEVCFETGFNSLTSFNRVFKELKSATPRDFKRRYQVLNSTINHKAYSA